MLGHPEPIGVADDIGRTAVAKVKLRHNSRRKIGGNIVHMPADCAVSVDKKVCADVQRGLRRGVGDAKAVRGRGE